MPFTHYPKLDSNVVFLWRLPIVPTKPGFLGRKHPKNLIEGPLKPGETLVAYHSSQNFTRFYGSIYADVPLVVTFTFSNDEYDDNGDFVTDKNISKLHYDAEAEKKLYAERSNGKFFVTIFGRWLKVEVHYPIKKEFDEYEDLQPDPNQKNCEILRLTVRASVF